MKRTNHNLGKAWSAAAVAVALFLQTATAGEMASQKWVTTRIAQQETNTQAWVNDRISESEANTDAKISSSEARINASVDTKVADERFRAQTAESENAQAIAAETTRAIAAEAANAAAINSETNRAKAAEAALTARIGSVESAITPVQADITAIKGKIPSEATSANKLADKAYVDEKVRLYASTFRGSFASWGLVPEIGTAYQGGKPCKNDYITIQEAAEYGTSYAGTWLFRYTADTWEAAQKNGWFPEYKISTTTMTAEQLAAINSGITAAKVMQIGSNTVAIADSRTYTDNAIAQQETNTQTVVDSKITVASSNIMQSVQSLISTTTQTPSNTVITAGKYKFTVSK